MSRRMVALVVLACLVVGVVGMLGRDLVRDLVSDTFGAPDEPARPLSAAEADRLASMRQHNWGDARAGVHATIGDRDDEIHAVGWVDWRRPSIYLALSGDQPGMVTELVQAIPGMIATRAPEGSTGPSTGPSTEPTTGPSTEPTTEPPPTADEIVDPHPPPPAQPPADGWQLRHPTEDGPAGAADAPGTIDTLVTLLFTIATDRPDAADALARSGSQWLRRDFASGYEVDVLLGPAVPPASLVPSQTPVPSPTLVPSQTPVPSPNPSAGAETATEATSLADMGGAVQYWLDDDARLHRLDALLAADTPVRVDLDRTDHTAPPVLDVLGGATIDPRPVTEDEAKILAGLRPRNLEAGGGEVTLTVPGEDATVRATGWLDWQRTIIYLAQAGDADGLLFADRQGVASRDEKPSKDGLPPLPVPIGEGWEWSPWEGRGDDLGGFDLDLLLNEALALSGWDEVSLKPLRQTAAWLRTDELSGTPVTVYEIPREFEAEVEPGEARMRYWVDDDGVLRRVEIRTRAGGYGQLDITPGEVPSLSPGS